MDENRLGPREVGDPSSKDTLGSTQLRGVGPPSDRLHSLSRPRWSGVVERASSVLVSSLTQYAGKALSNESYRKPEEEDQRLCSVFEKGCGYSEREKWRFNSYQYVQHHNLLIVGEHL
ncbi:hypothetical protein CGCF415_v014845 [Colletotrichum fructicola]|uniref:Uncharacterized protein n=1 Tax=Colletotrichum fructicola (strain Nara gc5) TaxID=1213859 RepID=A0A7J6J6P8_COLFN|nr:hypothetical protein CGGC5_v007040 [Colletotrichum fructicola Nara gc5]KAF4882940.1 hypothetical protein CGCFRS4_v014062 [Colletotrichum fructicola]KAF4887459.1 hypothetical protein CGCF415_v014845 [Colletotrichum fructicola]KAF4938139.1 hypothetical protein CGCF245_v005015 [Colletotrichum fructicola]